MLHRDTPTGEELMIARHARRAIAEIAQGTTSTGHDDMTDHPEDLRTEWWAKKFDDVDRELAKLAIICKVPLLDPGVIERVLKNDASVCGTPNPPVFGKLRSLLMMHYAVRDKAVEALGAAEAQALINMVVARLRERIGAKLGG
jgi:hypothetical protein